MSRSTTSYRAVFLALLVCLVSALALSCASDGPVLEAFRLGTGLNVIPASQSEAGEAAASLTLLAERTREDRGDQRAYVYGVSGRFSGITNSEGEPICGPGIAALLWVDPDAGLVRRVLRFADPGPGTPAPVLTATRIREHLYDLPSGTPPRAARVLVTVSGLFTGIDAGPAGQVDGRMFTGAVVVLDLDSPGPVNALGFDGSTGDTPLTFGEASADEQGIRATVVGTGHLLGARDLQGLNRIAEGRSVRVVLDLRGGRVEELSILGGPAPLQVSESLQP